MGERRRPRVEAMPSLNGESSGEEEELANTDMLGPASGSGP